MHKQETVHERSRIDADSGGHEQTEIVSRASVLRTSVVEMQAARTEDAIDAFCGLVPSDGRAGAEAPRCHGLRS
jgi:hypothetical protein